MTERDFDSDGNCIREVSVSEPEWSPLDLAIVIEAQRTARIPRNQYGIPYADALDPANNPFAPDATGHFVAEPVADFSAAAIEAAKEARKKAVGNDDWPLVWTARLEKFPTDSPEDPA